MVKFIGRFIDFLTLPDDDDHFIIEKWRKESDQADRLKELHRQSRKQTEKSKLKKSLKLEDFERANQTNKQKNKTLSSNF